MTVSKFGISVSGWQVTASRVFGWDNGSQVTDEGIGAALESYIRDGETGPAGSLYAWIVAEFNIQPFTKVS